MSTQGLMRFLCTSTLICTFAFVCHGQDHPARKFRILAFYTGENDLAHISFVTEALEWLRKKSDSLQYSYSSSQNWSDLNEEHLRHCDLVIFLDTRPDFLPQRRAFEKYMARGGAWIGFHFAGFALSPSAFPQNWDWYHEEFLGSGQYVSNTWRPTSAIVRLDAVDHPVVSGLPAEFKSSPNEWYRWEHDLRQNPDIEIIASISPKSFPLGTGPKQDEIWTEGYFPIVWTNKKYRMVYFNMGHNDMDYEGGTNRRLSTTFGNPHQDRLILNAITWLTKK